MSTRIWIGSIFLFVGFGILLHQLNVWDFSYIIRLWWPAIIILIGIIQLSKREGTSLVAGLTIIIIGGVLFLNQWTNINIFAFIWPLVFILIGVMIIFSLSKHKRPKDSTEDSIRAFTLFSGADLQSQSNNFQGGEVVAIFGGVDIDIRDTVISEDGATFEFVTIFGGIDILVPENVRVEISGFPILGGWENKIRKIPKDANTQTVKIHCITIFGGVEIKS